MGCTFPAPTSSGGISTSTTSTTSAPVDHIPGPRPRDQPCLRRSPAAEVRLGTRGERVPSEAAPGVQRQRAGILCCGWAGGEACHTCTPCRVTPMAPSHHGTATPWHYHCWHYHTTAPRHYHTVALPHHGIPSHQGTTAPPPAPHHPLAPRCLEHPSGIVRAWFF
jgi:hypothetical protein